MKKIIHLIFVLILAATVGIGVYRYMEYQKYAPLRNDYERIATEDYTAVFFSTFPIDHYTEDDFMHYRGIYLLKASYCIPDMETLNEYFTRVFEKGNEVETVYLGVRPDVVTADDLLNLVDAWNNMHFEVILAYPSLAYWKNLDEEEYPAILNAYTDFVNTLMSSCEDNEWLQEHLSLYFYNSTEWFVNNRAHYESDFNINEGMSHMLSMYSDSEHGFQLTPQNYEEELEIFETLVSDYRSAEKSEYPDLSKWDIVFFGDSVIAFSETSSIPGALSGLTGAHTYNCGLGGSSAAMHDEGSLGITKVVDAFLSEDLSCFEENSQIYAGMEDYLEHAKNKRQKCFVLDFGLNDFFGGSQVQSDDPYDPCTYAGALRTATEKLQEAFPDAVIVLMTPNFTSYFGNGLEPQSAVGGTMPDYAASVISICEEKDFLLYDSYNGLGIDGTNHTEYLMDGCHPNEATRYTMAKELAGLLTPLAEDRQ